MLGGTTPNGAECGRMGCYYPPTTTVDIFDPSRGTFRHNGSLAYKRAGATARLLRDGRVLVVGGTEGIDPPWGTIEIYDAGKGKSIVFMPPTAERDLSQRAVELLADGRVLFAGGATKDWVSGSTATLIFDPATGGFSDGPPMVSPRQGAQAVLLNDGRVLIAGGSNRESDDWHAVESVEILDPTHTNAGSAVIETANAVASATRLPDGRVLLEELESAYIGGCSSSVAPETFDPSASALTPAGGMQTARSGASRVIIHDGRVLFLGGQDADCQRVTSVEGFDSVSGTFQTIATGFPKVDGFTATPLADGRVLVAGGGPSYDEFTAKTWILTP